MATTKPPITARQIKAARGLLDWSQEQLAESCGLSIATIRKIEVGNISPRNTTMMGIRCALESAGLEFIEPNGVRQRPDGIEVYEGIEGLKAFFDTVYQSAVAGGDIVMAFPSVRPFVENLGNYHSSRMSKLQRREKIKCVITQDVDSYYFVDYCDYRFVSNYFIDSVPFYVYDDRVAIITFERNHSSKITVIQSSPIADSYRRQFYSMWDKATPLISTVDKRQSGTKSKKQGRS